MNNNSQSYFTPEERDLFNKITADVKDNSKSYRQAGKWLDEFYNETKEKDIIIRFGKARKYLAEQYEREEFIPERDAKKIILITWLLTDSDAENYKLNITKFEKWEWGPIGDAFLASGRLSRQYAAYAFANNKDSWMRLVNIAWGKITISRQKKKTSVIVIKIIATIISAAIILIGGIWTLIQIYESKTFKNIFHLSDKKVQIPAKKELLDGYGRTPLYVRTQKRVDDIYKKIENEKLNPWLFINAGVKVQIIEYNGKVISYEGVTFEGSPRLVFWSDDFIPPFIEDAIIKVFDQTIEECRKNNLDPKPYLTEAKSLLCGFINKVYSHMADMDQKLSSKGDLKKAGRKDVSYEFNKMNECLKKHYDAAILLASKDENLKNAD